MGPSSAIASAKHRAGIKSMTCRTKQWISLTTGITSGFAVLIAMYLLLTH